MYDRQFCVFLIRMFSIISFLILFLFNMKHTFYNTYLLVCCYFSVDRSSPTLCDPMDCCVPGSCVLHSLLEFAQIYVHGVRDAIQPSHLMLLSLLLLPQSFPASRSFSVSQLFTSGGQNIAVSTSALVLPMNIQGLFPLGLTGLTSLQSRGLSKLFSSTTLKALI